MRFRQFLGYNVLLEVVCNDHVVAVPDDFTDKRVHEQLAYLDTVWIFKHFGEQILLNVLYRQMRIGLLHRLVDLYLAAVDFFLQGSESVLRKVCDDALLNGFDKVVGSLLCLIALCLEPLQT